MSYLSITTKYTDDTINAADVNQLNANIQAVLGADTTPSIDLENLYALVLANTPVSDVYMLATSIVPDGFLECDGSTLDTTTYADLFDKIGYSWGGSGSSFNIPDMRGEFARGWDNGRGIDSGRVFGSNQVGAVVEHSHDSPVRSIHTTNVAVYSGNGYYDDGVANMMTQSNSAGTYALNLYRTGKPVAWDISNTASSVISQTENRVRNNTFMFVIKY